MNKLHHLSVFAGTASILLIFLGAFYPSHAVASDQVAMSFSPVADTYVKEIFPDKNSGSSTALRVDGFPIENAYLRFSVQGLGGLRVTSAQLQLYAVSRSGVGITGVGLSDNSWGEATMTYNNAPALGPSLSSSGPIRAGQWVPLDVSSYVTTEGMYSFGITTSGVTAIHLASRESGTNTAPRLVVVLQAPETATNTPTAANTETPTVPATAPSSDTPTLPPPPITETAPASATPVVPDTPTIAATAVNSNTPTAAATTISTDTPTVPPAPAGPIRHVFVVLMENRGYDQVWNTASSPYITQLGNSYSVATNYHAITHPSLPNYLDLVGGGNFGVTTDCLPSSACHVSGSNLGDLLEGDGLSWKAYLESMPTPCTITNSGEYAPKHNPFVYFDDILNDTDRCNAHDVPYSVLTGDLTSASASPNLAFISPNLCDDMHDCPVSTGDQWLRDNLSRILSSPACTSDTCLVMLTWDEDNGNFSNHVLTIFAGSGAKTGGVISSASYNHFSLLRTIESIFGLPSLTANDSNASPMIDLLR